MRPTILCLLAAAGLAACGPSPKGTSPSGPRDSSEPAITDTAEPSAPRPEDCTNALDDDLDTLIDCADPDRAEACAEDCADGEDNDADALVDCDDPDCDELCVEDCDDGDDNDADGLVDCADAECSDHLACPEDCDDGDDNDADGLVDCADAECEAHDSCLEDCTNGIDDDGDRLVDCEDAGCIDHPACAEVCGDGFDNDHDGLADCDDDECWPVCADITLRATGSSLGMGLRTSEDRGHSYAGASYTYQQSMFSGSLASLYGVLSIDRTSIRSPIQCSWTASDLDLSHTRFVGMAGWHGATTSSSGGARMASLSSSGGCPVAIGSFLPSWLSLRLGAGSLKLYVPTSSSGSERFATFARNGTLLSTATWRNEFSSGATWGQTSFFSSSFQLTSPREVVFEGVVLP